MPAVLFFSEEFAPHFERLNREWIEAHFAIEEADEAVFRQPHTHIVERGGQIFFIEVEGEVVGTCAVIHHNEKVYELAKMAVTPRARGRGYGDLLVLTAIEFAHKQGAEVLMLLTNSSLEPALRLYEKHGFKHVPVNAGQEYARADVQMELNLNESFVSHESSKMS
jgi:N-acetylglutamate synthase-like GNAT family acetyltransferase